VLGKRGLEKEKGRKKKWSGWARPVDWVLTEGALSNIKTLLEKSGEKDHEGRQRWSRIEGEDR